MKEYFLNTNDLREKSEILHAGDKIYLSGTAYTARDAAHKRIFELIKSNSSLPFDLKDAVIYYAGPTPTPEGFAIGSCGPTTSCRMDPYTAALYDMGVVATIGKGVRSADVCSAVKRNKALYLCAIGGAGALAAKSITDCTVIAFDELGCESVKKIEFSDFPLVVAVDAHGNNLFDL